jgi:hypothetical protein
LQQHVTLAGRQRPHRLGHRPRPRGRVEALDHVIPGVVLLLRQAWWRPVCRRWPGARRRPPVSAQHVASDPVQPGPRVGAVGPEGGPRGECANPDLAQQVIGRLAAGPAGEEPVHGNLVSPDNLDERVGSPAHGPLDQRTVCLHSPAFLYLGIGRGRPERSLRRHHDLRAGPAKGLRRR